MNSTLFLDGLRFSVRTHYDAHHGEPWKEEDGHGPVTEWRRYGDNQYPTKAPGERVLARDGNRRALFYDMQAATRQARAEGWGLSGEETSKLANRLGREPTQGDIRAAAVEADFQRLRGFCNDEWYYVGVVVTLLDDDGEETGESGSLWGIESDSVEYLDEVAQELAAEIADRVADKLEVLDGLYFA